MALLKGKIKHKAEKDIKAGEELEIQGDFEFDQEDFDRVIKPRLKRETDKVEQLTKEKDTLATELETLKKGQKADPDAETAKRIQDLEKVLGETTQALKAKELAERINGVLAAKKIQLPSAYRAALQLTPDATDDDITTAVTEQQKRFDAEMQDLGLTKNTTTTGDPGKKGGTGFQGNGTPPKDTKGQGAAALQKLKQNRPQYLDYIKEQSPEKQEAQALKWDAEGKLEAKK